MDGGAWLNAPVSKTGDGETRPGGQIPLHQPTNTGV